MVERSSCLTVPAARLGVLLGVLFSGVPGLAGDDPAARGRPLSDSEAQAIQANEPSFRSRLFAPQPLSGPIAVHVGGMPARPSAYWIGVVSEPVPEALRSHLKLKENEGLLVQEVAPESPAAAAKLQKFDILLKANGKALTALDDLIEAVDAAKEGKLALELIRSGQPVKVEVAPAKRPEGDAARFLAPAGPPGADPWDAMRQWFEQARPGEGVPAPFSFYMVRPGIVLARPGTLPDLPKDVTITITKQGKEPAKIAVTRGSEKWEVGEGELDKLPADLRPHVEWMLRHHLFGTLGPRGDKLFHFAPDTGAFRVPRRGPEAKPEGRKEPAASEKQLRQLERRVEELLEDVEHLKKMHAAEGSKSPSPDKTPQKK